MQNPKHRRTLDTATLEGSEEEYGKNAPFLSSGYQGPILSDFDA